MTIDIPHFKRLNITHLVLDYNGTIAVDGTLLLSVKQLLPKLCEHYQVHVITADTFGSVKEQLQDYPVTLKILTSNDHTQEKAEYLDSLGTRHTVAIGNGNNDTEILKKAVLGIALIGKEGCATSTLVQSDLVCREIEEALQLLISPKRLIATLRR
jgi:soluble P-type ATPase